MVNYALLRIVDENLDRLSEGLRVLEDLARMILDNADLTSQLKNLRHDLVRQDLDFNLDLLQSRDSQKDVGENLTISSEGLTELPLIALANARRSQEALRVLEDISKLPELNLRLDSNRFKTARFILYTVEKELVASLTRRDRAARLKGLYVIVDTGYLGSKDARDISLRLLEAGVKIIQLRSKNLDKKQVLEMAAWMKTQCRQAGALFIVNDYLDVALAVQADGLHIGQSDLPSAVARRLIPITMLLGVSATSVVEAQTAAREGADYLGVGAIFSTSTKAESQAMGSRSLTQIKTICKVPLAAIGGINAQNITEVMRAGADSACVISAVLGAPDPGAAARRLINIIEDLK
jgi:thiamine-phosphate pyrophosphorylase